MPIRPPRYVPCGPARAFYSSFQPVHQRKSPHADWYSLILPSMVPIAILGSSVYLGLHLVQTTLSQERYADHARTRIQALENELASLREQKMSKASVPKSRIQRWWFF